MTQGIWAAVSGAKSQIRRLDVAANNAANASTPGYRADKVVFGEVLARASENAALRMARVETIRPSFEQGEVVQTGRQLDVAIVGDGFFSVEANGQRQYTRAGNIQLSSTGQLTTPTGDPYLSAGGAPLEIIPDAKRVEFAPDGALIVDGQRTGDRIGVIQFEDQSVLKKEGAYLSAPENAGFEVEGNLALQALEMSNASAVEAMSGMVTASRHFEFLQRVIQQMSEIERRTALNVGKV